MGGKTKQAQRTKNNARPSSSGRSAELLAGGALPALFPSLAAAAPAPGLSADLALVVKKLNKKDPITKTKALQELNELIKNSKVDEVVALLPNWTHFYKTLSLDPDRRVRELTQLCHGSIVSVSGRKLAPHLKAVLPSWLQAQYDEYGPAQSKAQLSLNTTFPENKLLEAISFCKVEVITHLTDNILNPDAAVSKKVEVAEEREAAVSRVVAASLRALRGLCEAGAQGAGAPEAGAQGALGAWLWVELEPLLAAPAFWKLANHADYSVRCAWYSAACALAARFGPAFCAAHGARALRALLAAREPAPPALWPAVLEIMTQDPQWWERVDCKLVTKRALQAVATGGGGDARPLARTLPALLARLPAHLLTAAFYTAFFEACFKGLESRHISSSRSERQAWATSLAECIRWAAQAARGPAGQVGQDGQVGQEGQVGHEGHDAALAAHRAWLKILTSAPQAVIRSEVRVMAELLKSWLTTGASSGSGDVTLVRGFWLNVSAAAAAQLTSLGARVASDVTALLDAHVLILNTLRTALAQEPKKQYSIKFSDEVVTGAGPELAPPPETPPPLPPLPARAYEHELRATQHRVCAQYLEFARDVSGDVTADPAIVDCVVAGLLPLLEHMDAEQLVSLSREFGGSSVLSLFERVLRPWLADERTRARAVLAFSFLLLPHLNESEQDALLGSVSELGEAVVEWCVRECLAARGAGAAAARRWLRAGGAAAAATRAAAAAAGGASGAGGGARDLLMACLHHDCALNEQAIHDIVDIVRKALVSEEGGVDVGVAASVATALATPTAVPTAAPAPPDNYEDLILALFEYALKCPVSEPAGAQRMRELLGAVQDALAPPSPSPSSPALSAPRRQRCTKMLLDALHRYLGEKPSEIDTERISRAAAVCPYLVPASRSPAQVAELAALVLPPMEPSRNAVLPPALRRDVIAGELSCPLAADTEPERLITTDDETELTLPAFVSFARACLLRAEFVRALSLDADADPIEHDDFVALCVELLHDAAIVRSLKNGYDFWPNYAVIERTEGKLSALVEAITSDMSEEGRGRLLARLADTAAARGHYWSVALVRFNQHFKIDFDLSAIEDKVSGDGFFHTLQAQAALSPDLSLHAEALLAQRALLRAGGAGGVAAGEGAGAEAAQRGLEACVRAHYADQQLLLHDTELMGAEWSRAEAAARSLSLARCAVEAHGWELAAHHWDFVTISLVSLLASVDKSKQHWATAKVSLVCVPALRLYRAVQQFAGGVRGECERRQPPAHVAALPSEWQDLFSPAAKQHVHHLLLHILENDALRSEAMTSARALVTLELAASVPAPAPRDVTATRRARAAGAALARAAAPAHYKWLAYHTMLQLVDTLVGEDVEKLNGDSSAPLALSHLEQALRTLPDVVTELLDRRDRRLAGTAADGTHNTQEETEEKELLERASVGWLLAAELAAALLHAADARRTGLALRYLDELRALRHVENVVPCALRLLPDDVAAWAADPALSAPPPPAHRAFTAPPDRVEGAGSGELACRALFAVLRGGGAGAARGWWAAAEPRSARALERLVTAYVAPALVLEQLEGARAAAAAGQLPDTTVRAHRTAAELVATTLVDERAVELSVQLSRAHPLVAPRVRREGAGAGAGRAGAAPDAGWLAALLAHRNCSLAEALRLWARALLARVEAAPVCYVCYCRLHPASGRLPADTCRQCKNTFHTQCLKKWFASSSKSNCPLCRASF